MTPAQKTKAEIALGRKLVQKSRRDLRRKRPAPAPAMCLASSENSSPAKRVGKAMPLSGDEFDALPEQVKRQVMLANSYYSDTIATTYREIVATQARLNDLMRVFVERATLELHRSVP